MIIPMYQVKRTLKSGNIFGLSTTTVEFRSHDVLFCLKTRKNAPEQKKKIN